MSGPRWALLCGLLAAGHGALAGAEQVMRPRWELGAGAAGLSMPDYRGSDRQRAYLLPIPYLVYRGDVLKVDREKIRGLLFKSERLELDLSLNGSVPVNSSDNAARRGMPNLDPTVEVGPQLNIKLYDSDKYRFSAHTPWRTVVAVDHGHTRNVGWRFSPALNLDIKNTGPDKGWNLGISGGPVWADSRYHDFVYGVQAPYATAERAAYRGKGGYSGTDFTLALSKRYPHFWAGAFVRVSDLHGTAFDDSPLLRSKTSYMAGIGLSWVFAQSARQALSDE